METSTGASVASLADDAYLFYMKNHEKEKRVFTIYSTVGGA